MAFVAGLLFINLAVPAYCQEFRAMWADTFHAGLRNPSETAALIAAARAAKCNAVVVEVRKRGDAYYRNGLEPIASDVEAGFDPLADLIQRGRTGSPRIEVHAWLVAYNIWNSQNSSPVQPDHPFNRHPDWLTQNNAGATWDGGNYQFDQAHPAVQEHTYNVVMDILRRYDVDGIHFDYIRYSERGSNRNNQPWGYNPVSVARFKTLKNRTSTPSPTDSEWLQWRRDQVTAFLRKVYLNAWATKPHVRISAALIPWSTPPADMSLATWQNTEAYSRVLQDWRAWMEEGILDLACPMVYRKENVGFDGWADFAKDRQYNRAAAIGMGWYLNPIENTIAQIKNARSQSPGGRTPAGVLGYSYAVPNSTSTSRSENWRAFTDDDTAEDYDPGGSPVFASAVSTPSMPWKTNTTKGHLMGYVRQGAAGPIFDGATITLAGPANRTLTSDATGFFGAVDLPVGTYTLTVLRPGYRAFSQTVTLAGAAVTEPAIQIEPLPLQVNSLARSAAGDRLTITWSSVPGRAYRVEASPDLQAWTVAQAGITATAAATSYQWPVPEAWRAHAYLRVTQE